MALKKYIAHIFLFICLASSLYHQKDAFAEVLSGRIEITITDNEDGSSEEDYFLVRTSGQHIYLSNENLQQQLSQLSSGDRVRISFSSLNTPIRINTILRASLAHDKISTPRRVAIILVNMGEEPPVMSAAEAADVYFLDNNSATNLIDYSTRGLYKFNGDANSDGLVDIYGPINIDAKFSAGCPSTERNRLTELAYKAAVATGANLTQYEHLSFVFPSYTTFGCDFYGYANYNSSRSTILKKSTKTIAHEFGHNLGLRHAAKGPAANNPNFDEYGDYSCTMGRTTIFRGFNAPHLLHLGYFQAFPEQMIDLDLPGTYQLRIAPLEQQESVNQTSSLRVIRIRQPTESILLSFRGSDPRIASIPANFLNGVSVHRELGDKQFSFLAATLRDNQARDTDDWGARLGVSIRQLSHTTQFVDLQIVIPDPDQDADGTVDSQDCAPSDPNIWAGKAYVDSDGDGVRDSDILQITGNCFGTIPPAGYVLNPVGIDLCPSDANKSLPLVCGCGVADLDLNGNGVVDCLFSADLVSEIHKLSQIINALSAQKPQTAEIQLALSLVAQIEQSFISKPLAIATKKKAKALKLLSNLRPKLSALSSSRPRAFNRKHREVRRIAETLVRLYA